MSDESSAKLRDARRDFIAIHTDTYLSSGGAQGHVMDVSAVGGHAFTPHCLIRYTGRKSGKIFITPLIYGSLGGEIILVGSKGGADQHPGWILNIRASEAVDVQVGGQAWRAGWREPVGAERDHVWAYMAEVYPPYVAYQASTERQIPIIMLKPGEAIGLFKAEDATGERQY